MPLPVVRLSVCLVVTSVLACGASNVTPVSGNTSSGDDGGADGGGGGMDASANADAATPDAAGLGALTPCPATGQGAYGGPGTCALVTPAESGAAATGQNAAKPSVAVAADSATATGKLVLYFNGSGGHPGNIPDPVKNFYAAATSVGDDVLALSYASDQSIGSLCKTDDPCYFATRKSIILGVPQAGAAGPVASITLDEGIVDRVVLTLTNLAAHAPAGRWQGYLVAGATGAPESRIAWSKVTVVGHSQGGGHAAATGKLFAVARVIQLSSTCDANTTARTPASWTSAANGPWASDPSQFYGLAAPTIFTGNVPTGGDTTCGQHAAVWANLGLIAAHQHDDAATCGMTGDTHNASIRCADNYPTWVSLLQ